MHHDFDLHSLQDCILHRWSWETSQLSLDLSRDDSERLLLTFSGVCQLKAAIADVNDPSENEIWRIEVVDESPLIKALHRQADQSWLVTPFGAQYQRTKLVRNPSQLRHVVLLSDYVDLEFLCTDFLVTRNG